MKLINLSKSNCKNCYKCVNSCKVKAIKIYNDQAEIVANRCLSCGHCLVVCPQHARTIKNDVIDIKEVIKSNKKVIASISPEFIGAFNLKKFKQIVTALKRLGFDFVEETTKGEQIITELYKEKLRNGEYTNFITTNCPSVCYMIEIYFPSLIKYMVPVVSSMIAHGKLLKNIYGQDSYVVYIGSCISRKRESLEKENRNYIDAVITFEELKDWIKEENIDLYSLEESEFDNKCYEKNIGFSVLGQVSNKLVNDFQDYEFITVDGANRCMEIFRSIQNREISKVFIEANICKGGCVKGPGMPESNIGYYEKRRQIKEYINKKSEHNNVSKLKIPEFIDFSRKFYDRSFVRKKATEEEIKKILRKMGKYEIEDELNCGGCGYSTCREKAQAVFEGMSEAKLCLPYIRSKAESLKNVIFENSPDIIFIVDKKLRIKEFNPVAEKTFRISAENIKNKPLSILMDDTIFKKVIQHKVNVIKNKTFLVKYELVMMQNIIFIEKYDIMLAIMRNITKEEKGKKELCKVKKNTFNAAQEVIDKQMRVAQQIASLLGETTAETKVILTKLKNITMEEYEE